MVDNHFDFYGVVLHIKQALVVVDHVLAFQVSPLVDCHFDLRILDLILLDVLVEDYETQESVFGVGYLLQGEFNRVQGVLKHAALHRLLSLLNQKHDAFLETVIHHKGFGRLQIVHSLLHFDSGGHVESEFILDHIREAGRTFA